MADETNTDVTPFPVPRERLYEAPEAYARWRREGPLCRVTIRDGATAWAVTTHQGVREVLTSQDTSANRLDPRFPNLRAGVVTLNPGSNILHTDEPEHGLYRRMLAPEFTPRRIAAMASRIRELVGEAVDRLLDAPRPADFHQPVSQPIPSQVICLLLGIDYAAHELFESLTQRLLTFLAEPEQTERVRRQSDLMAGAIEEVLRIHSITDLTVPKLAAQDMTVAGCPVSAGEGILPLTAAANHDPEVFPDPARFDPVRGDRRHLTFGLGVHACLGQNLARTEMEAVFSAVLHRVPSLRLAVPVSDLEPDRNAIVWGVKALPVTCWRQ